MQEGWGEVPDHEMKQAGIDQEMMLGIKEIVKRTNSYLKHTPVVIEFPDKVIQVHAFNEFSILMADTGSAKENMNFINFTSQVEKIGRRKHMRFRSEFAPKLVKRHVKSGYAKNRTCLMDRQSKTRLISAAASKVMYPHSRIEVEHSKQPSQRLPNK